VVELAADPWGLRSEVEAWAQRHGEDRVLEFNTGTAARMGPATDRLYQAVTAGTVTHDGDPRLAAHIANCVAKATTHGDLVTKDRRNSPARLTPRSAPSSPSTGPPQPPRWSSGTTWPQGLTAPLGVPLTGLARRAYFSQMDNVGMWIGFVIGGYIAVKLAIANRPQVNDKLVCPHCATTGQVKASVVSRKQGITGGKATGALMTGGLSMAATGLSRKQIMRHMACGNCGTEWDVA
jgi:hypothetical protein